jgi:hypothetical protein
MSKSKEFRRMKHAEIDSDKWNKCIYEAPNSRIYAYDWHLDRTAVIWDALVWGDYEYVMPLPFRKKLGIYYLYHPMYTQQLGIFPSPPAKVAESFYNYIYQNFRYSDTTINAENIPLKLAACIKFNARNNYLLSLSPAYTELAAKFSTNTKRNIAKAKKQKLNLVAGIRLEDYLEFASEFGATQMHKKELVLLKTLIAFGQRKGKGEIYGVYTQNNELCTAVYFCKNKERLIYLSATTSPRGKEIGAMYFLLNEFIKQHACKPIILDFEGSMLNGVARFYKGFGAKTESYFQLKFNRLPLPLKWLKK